MNVSSGYRADIDGLRAVAVLSVLFYHLGVSGFGGGFVGVDVFFVISGFLITSIIRRDVETGTFTFGDFYARRARRILPALFTTLFGSLLIAVVLLAPAAFRGFADTMAAAALSVSNFYFWIESGYFAPDAKLQPLLHTWSLAVEEQFYLLWPATLVFLLRWPPRFVGTPLVLTIIIGIASLLGAEMMLDIDPVAAFFLLPFRAVELAIGAALVWLPFSPRSNIARESTLVCGLLLIGFAVTQYSEATRFPGAAALLPCIGAALIILANSPRYSGALLRNEIARRIGLISYSLYLVHWPLITFYKYQTMAGLDAAAQTAIGASSVLVAILMYKIVEQPFRKRLEERQAQVQRLKYAVASVVAFVLITASATSGWTWRIGEDGALLDGLDKSAEFHVAYYGGAGCEFPFCQTHPESGKPKLYVIGDSIAKSYYAGIAKEFPDTNVAFWTSEGCQFFSIDRDSIKSPRGRRKCIEAKQRAIAQITAEPAPVILAQMWGIGRSGMESNDGNIMRFESYASYAEFVVGELNLLHKSLQGIPLTVIGSAPRFGDIGSPMDCVGRPVLSPEMCRAVPRERGNMLAATRLNETLQKHAGSAYEFLDPIKMICNKKECPNFLGSRPLFSDGSHLSTWGSEYLVQKLAPDILRAAETHSLSGQ